MRANIIRIGNSQGIRIPKLLLERCRLGTEVEEVEGDKIVIRRSSPARQGWAEKFRLAAVKADEKLRGGYTIELTAWDKDEWEW